MDRHPCLEGWPFGGAGAAGVQPGGAVPAPARSGVCTDGRGAGSGPMSSGGFNGHRRVLLLQTAAEALGAGSLAAAVLPAVGPAGPPGACRRRLRHGFGAAGAAEPGAAAIPRHGPAMAGHRLLAGGAQRGGGATAWRCLTK